MFDVFIWIDYFTEKGDLDTVQFIKNCYLIGCRDIASANNGGCEVLSFIDWCLFKLMTGEGGHGFICKTAKIDSDQRTQIEAFLKKIMEIDGSEETDKSLIRIFNVNHHYILSYMDDKPIGNDTPTDYIAQCICSEYNSYRTHDFTYLGLPDKYEYKFAPVHQKE